MGNANGVNYAARNCASVPWVIAPKFPYVESVAYPDVHDTLYVGSESSRAAISAVIVSTVSSPMFERRKVLPFSFP